ncbi:MAG: tetratricopeptide repeat protein [Bacilli bacterium]|jgi:tetratricopeptide (TPR) repeat protein|nr:tetratricopeptide repeat protein [Bacilli bacterium]
MRKLFFSLVILTISTTAFAQSGKKDVSSAYNHYLNRYWDRAKSSIDKAITFEDTKNDAKTWLYRGNIYLQIASTNDPNYQGLCDNCAEVACEAYLKALQLDKDVQAPSMGIATPAQGLRFCSDLLYNEAIKQIKAKNYERAYGIAEKSYNSNKNSEGAIFVLALTAELVNKKDVAKERYNQLIKRKTKLFEPYFRLANIYKEENDTINALKAINAEPGDTSFNINYTINKAVVLMWAGEVDRATKIMDDALDKEPNNHLLLFGLGSALSDQKKYEEAEKYLLKAMEVNPNDVNTTYNLGNSYYNHYVDIYKSLDEIDINDTEGYNKALQECQSLLRKALPLLEKAYELDPNDKNTLIMLKTVYPRIDKKEGEEEIFSAKLKEIDEKLSK